MLFAKYKLVAIAGCVVIAVALTAYTIGYVKGGAGCEVRHAVEQLKVNEKLEKTDAKIDKITPIGASRKRSVEWLREYGRSGQ